MKEYIERNEIVNEIIEDYIGLYNPKQRVDEIDGEDVHDGNVKEESCSVCKVKFITSKESSMMELEIGEMKICHRCYDRIQDAIKEKRREVKA